MQTIQGVYITTHKRVITTNDIICCFTILSEWHAPMNQLKIIIIENLHEYLQIGYKTTRESCMDTMAQFDIVKIQCSAKVPYY